MSRMVGTVSRGVRAPIIRSGDDLVEIVTKSVLEAAAQPEDGFAIRDRDVVAMTEAIVARAQGNYASTDDIASDVKAKLGGGTVGVIFPILSRNRFAVCLRGIAKGARKIVLMLSYPSDEVGNHLIEPDLLDEAGINPWSDVLTEARYRELFGETPHYFTGVDYVSYYRDLIEKEGCELEIIFANDAREILKHTGYVLTCDIHTRARAKRRLTITCAHQRMLYGRTTVSRPSRFLAEIPEELVERKQHTQPRFVQQAKPRPRPTMPHSDTLGSHHASGPVIDFRKGDTVVHDVFGRGLVLSVLPTGNDKMLEIAFDQIGTKRLMANFAASRMKKL